MIKELNEIIVGFDLGMEFSQITYYSYKTKEPITVSTVEGQEKYMIPTPPDLFPLVEEQVELAAALLGNFLKDCFGLIPGNTPGREFRVMMTMTRMMPPWPETIYQAFSMLGITRDRVYLQDYAESFFNYTINQKKDLWNYRVGLFEYEDSMITAYELAINYKTKPALAAVNQIARLPLDKGVRGNILDREWDAKRDGLFLELIQLVFKNKTFSSVYLIGDNFDKTWAVKSLNFLCSRRHVFQGRNLYTKGACYGAMMRMKMLTPGDFLYVSEAMVEVNVGMQMYINGRDSYYLLVNAGGNWYEANHTCEFILDDTIEITVFTKPIDGSPARSQNLELKGLPKRPERTTRIQLEAAFLSVHECRIQARDLGFGELFPSTGQTYEMILEV